MLCIKKEGVIALKQEFYPSELESDVRIVRFVANACPV